MNIVAAVIAAIVIAAGSFLWGNHHGYGKAEAAYMEERKDQAEDNLRYLAAELEKRDAVWKRHVEINQGVINALETKLADISQRPAGRSLRIPAAASTFCGATPGSAPGAAAGGATEADPGTVLLPEQVEAHLWDLAIEADRLTEYVWALREWTRLNGFEGP